MNWNKLRPRTATSWWIAGVAAAAVLAAVAMWFLGSGGGSSRAELEARIAKGLMKRPAVLVDAFDGREIRHWQAGSQLKLRHKAWIHSHTSHQDMRPLMPQLELHLAPYLVGPVQARLRVEYVRGNGKRRSRTTEQDRVSIPRDQIWNWQSNVAAAFGIITHQFKGSLAERYFNRIEQGHPNGEQLLEQCPPPAITVAGETFTAHQAVWITAYNGWGGRIQNRFVFSKDKPCGLGPGKRWQWNPPVKPNGKTYLRLIAEEME